MSRITGKYLTVCLAVLSAVLLSVPAEVRSLQDEKNPDFEMVVQKNHSALIYSVSFSPDGEYIVSGADDSTFKLWNRDGMLLRTFYGHSAAVVSVSFTPDGRYILSGSKDGTIKLWTMDGRLIRTIEGYSGWGNSIAFSPDGKHIAAGGWDKKVKLWNLEGKLIGTFEGHSDRVTSVAFSPDGRHIVSGSGDKTIKLWNLDGKLVRTISRFFSFNGHSASVESVAFSPDGRHIVSGSWDKTVKLWTTEGKLLRTLKGHAFWVMSVLFSPDGKYIVSGSLDGRINIWSAGGELVKTLKDLGGVNSVSFSRDGKYIIAGPGSTGIRLWSLDGKPVKTFASDFNRLSTLSFTPDGKHIVSGSYGGPVKLWNMEGKLSRTLEGHSGWVESMSISSDGKYVLSGSFGGSINLWDMKRDIVRTFEGHSGAVRSVSFDPNGKYFVSGSRDKTVKLWNLDGKLIRTFDGHPDEVTSVAFSPDGKHIASGSWDKTVRLWNTAGELLKTLKGHSGFVQSVAYSPDGKYLASGSDDKTVKLWDMEGTLVRTFDSGPVEHVIFSPDSKTIVAFNWRNELIKFWSLDGELIKTFKESGSNGISFSPDGKYLASGSADSSIKLWDMKTGNHFSFINKGTEWLMYTPDGYFDASPHGGELVAMVKGMEAFGVDQFAARNNRPDLILERMGLGTPEQITHYNLLYQKRLKKLGLTEAALSSELHTPEAKITGTKQDGKFINVSFSFSDSKYPLKKYNIYVNDVPLFGSGGKGISGKSFAGSEKIELTAGRNKIELSAMNNAGAESYRALAYADYDGKEKGALYYLAFGASKYKDAQLSLNYADKDVKDLEAVLSKMRPAYSDIHVKTFLNNEVTPENITKAKDFLKDAKTDDTVILAIAGHGGYSKGKDPKYYYVAYETNVDNLSTTGVDFEAIEDLLDDIKPRKKLFLLDTCESGELDENIYENYYTLADARGMKPRTYRKPMKARGTGESKGRGYLYEKDRFIYNDLSRRTGAVVFSSSKGGEISYESSAIQNGFFTKEIINALTNKAADKNNDGKIDTNELRDFVSGAVAKGTGGLQHPTIDRDNLYQKIDLPLILN